MILLELIFDCEKAVEDDGNEQKMIGFDLDSARDPDSDTDYVW